MLKGVVRNHLRSIWMKLICLFFRVSLYTSSEKRVQAKAVCSKRFMPIFLLIRVKERFVGLI